MMEKKIVGPFQSYSHVCITFNYSLITSNGTLIMWAEGTEVIHNTYNFSISI